MNKPLDFFRNELKKKHELKYKIFQIIYKNKLLISTN